MSIRQFNQRTPTTASQIPFYDPVNGCDARCSAQDLAAVMFGDDPDADDFITQYASPNATGFSVTISPQIDGQNVWLLLTPTGAFAAGTVVLPPKANLADHQEVEVTCSQVVTALTVSGNGATVTGAPTTLTANQVFKLRYDAVGGAWWPAT